MVLFFLVLIEEIGYQFKIVMFLKYWNYLWNENVYVFFIFLYMVRFSYIYFCEELSDGFILLYKMKFNLDFLNLKLLSYWQFFLF